MAEKAAGAPKQQGTEPAAPAAIASDAAVAVRLAALEEALAASRSEAARRAQEAADAAKVLSWRPLALICSLRVCVFRVDSYSDHSRVRRVSSLPSRESLRAPLLGQPCSKRMQLPPL